MKKIIFDISVLGKGYLDKTHRTGTYRAAEEIFIKLSQSPQIDLYFIASQLNINGCIEYLKATVPDRNLELKLISFNPEANINNRIFYKLYMQLVKCNKKFPKFKLVKKIINHYGTLLHYLQRKVEFIKDIGTYDAYISPYNMFPIQVCESKIKKILIIHDLIPIILPESTSFLARKLQTSLIKHFPKDALIICNSKTTKKDLLKYRTDLDDNKVEVIYFGTSEIFKPTQELRDNSIKNLLPPYVKKYILAVSSLNPRKNFLHIINSFLSLIKTNNIGDLYLVIVGPKGWEYQEIFNKLEDIGDYKDKIIMTGYVEDRYLPYLYSRTLCFVMMSLYEGFGFPVLEAMKCGAPVVVSDNSSLSELVEEAGIKLPPKDQPALVEALYLIYSSTTKQHKMSVDSINQAKKFSWEGFINKLMSIL